MILVTGATGHSAHWFFKRLKKEGYEEKIRCVVRTKSRLKNIEDLKLNFDFVYGDLEDEQFLRKALDGVDTVLHIAGIHYSRSLVKLGEERGVKWFILVHTTGRYSKFKSASAEYVKIEEGILETYKNITVLRPTMIYGCETDNNMWKLISFVDRFRFFPVFGNGKNLMQPVHAKDLGDAYYMVLNHKAVTLDKQYNLSGRNELTYKNLLILVANRLGRNTFFIHFPISICLFGAYLYNFIFGKKAIISVEQVKRMNEDKVFSWNFANQDFDYNPMSFEQGIAMEIDLYHKSKCLNLDNEL